MKRLIRPSNWLRAEIYSADMTSAEAARKLGVTHNALRRALIAADHMAPSETYLQAAELAGIARQLACDYVARYGEETSHASR